MKKYTLILLLLLPAIMVTRSYGQSAKYIIQGSVLDSATHQPLESATVYIGQSGDSTVIALGFTDAKGSFILKDIPRDQEVLFKVFYTGYSRYHKVLKNISTDTVRMGKIYLSMNANSLDAVTVLGEKPPIAIKGDTVEFNASSFKTRPNSVLSELLKKLPGVDVESDGSITANGKKVDKIMVNGKKFFGDDPQVALQNIPAAIIDKVQVTDTKTREEELTDEPASGDTKTINITLKKGNDHGFFGRAYAGYGTGEHYDASAMLNYFSGDRQISLLGATNNINQVGFSMNEIAGMVGTGNIRSISISSDGSFGINGMNFGSGGEGLKKSTTAGINFNDAYGKHLSVNGSYFYGGSVADNETQTARQNILPDSIFYYHANRVSHSDNMSHRGNATISYKDSLWRIYYEPSIDVTHIKSSDKSIAASNGAKNQPVNESKSLYLTDARQKHFRNNLNIFRMLKQKGQNLSLNFSMDNNVSQGNNYNQYNNIFYNDSAPDDSANQLIHNHATRDRYNAGVRFKQPLAERLSMEVGYKLNVQHSLTDRETFNYDDISGKYTTPDTAYSNRFRSNTISQSPDLGLSLQGDSGSWRLDVGSAFNIIGLHHYSFTHDMAFDQNQFFISPTVFFYKKVAKSGRVTFRYSANIRQPDIAQLLPVSDNTNSLYIVKGNPDLKPSIRKSLDLGYNNYDFKSGNMVYLSLSYFNTKNDIASVTTIDDQLRQNTTYTNVKSNDGFNLNLNLAKSKKQADYHWRIGLNTYNSFNNRHAFVNGVPYTSKSYNLSLRPSLTYGYKELFEVTPALRTSYQFSKYDIESLRNRKNMMNEARLSGTLYWPGRVTWTSDWTYTRNSNVTPGFRKAFWLWNASVSLDVFKNKQGTLALSVYDLLNQNISVRRNITDTYIEDTQTIILHRYFMLKFTYNLRKFGEKKKKQSTGSFFFF